MAHSPTSEPLLSPPPQLPEDPKKKKKWKKKKKILVESQLNLNDPPQQQQPPPHKRNKCPGVRVRGGRIFDSENGRTCHQCRQKTMDFVALCKSRKEDKPCRIMFCVKCLSNRYGEKAEEVNQSDDWKCPKCRGVCNCSFCMKKRGQQPTGILVHAAKATGFHSVLEMLNVNGPEIITLLRKRNKLASPKENTSDGSKSDNNLKKKAKKSHLRSEDDLNTSVKAEEEMTKGAGSSEKKALHIKLKELARAKKIKPVKSKTDIDLPAEDVEQFLEFCNAFGEELLSEKIPDVQVLEPVSAVPLQMLASLCNLVHTIS